MFLHEADSHILLGWWLAGISEEHDKLEMGYKQFMAEIYGHNILFTDGEDNCHLMI